MRRLTLIASCGFKGGCRLLVSGAHIPLSPLHPPTIPFFHPPTSRPPTSLPPASHSTRRTRPPPLHPLHSAPGSLAGLDFHAHMLKFWGSSLFSGTPNDVGVARWIPTYSPEPILVKDAGYADNAALHTYLLQHIKDVASSGRKHPYSKTALRQPRIVPTDGASSPKGATPTLVCDARGNTEIVDGVRWDRRASVECSPWKFGDDAPFTLVSFMGPLREPAPAPASPAASDATGATSDDAPAVKSFAGMAGEAAKGEAPLTHYPMHTAFLIYYVADDQRSHYSNNVYGTHLDDVDIIMTRRDIFRHMFNGGKCNGHKCNGICSTAVSSQ